MSNEKAAKLSEEHSNDCASSKTQKPENVSKRTATNNESRSSHIPVPSTSGATRPNSNQHPPNSSQQKASSTSTATRRLLRRDTFSKGRPDCPNVSEVSSNTAQLNITSQQLASRNASSLNRTIHQAGSSSAQSNSTLTHRQSSNPTNDATSDNVDGSGSSNPESENPILVNCSDRINSQQVNPEETFFAMCSDSSAVFDENLIDANNSTPPPSYSEVLSVESISGQTSP